LSATDQWMPLYIPDYLRDTGHLTTAEHGAYLLLLMQAWTRKGLLPADDERMRMLTRMERKEWARSRDTLLAFFVRDGDHYRNTRLDIELQRAAEIVTERQKAGRAGAAKRWQRDGRPIANAMANAIAEPLANASQTQWQTDAPLHLQEQEIPPSPPSVVRSPRGSRLPADWQPSDADREFARSLNLDAGRVSEQFRDFWHAKAGKDAVKLDWPATWRGWCRRDADSRWKQRPFAPKPASALGQWADLMQPPQRADLDGHAEEVFP
jgi:uncharacterized protein YdaU (DUF1376 family)